MKGIKNRAAFALVGGVVLAALAACSDPGPSTAAEVCEDYDELSMALIERNGLFDNTLFRRAGDLGDSASRYEANAAVQADGEVLVDISDSSSTSGIELESASRSIAALCDAPPLTINAVLGGG